MERIKVDVSLPKFKTEFSTSLVDALLQMGIISGLILLRQILIICLLIVMHIFQCYS